MPRSRARIPLSVSDGFLQLRERHHKPVEWRDRTHVELKTLDVLVDNAGGVNPEVTRFRDIKPESSPKGLHSSVLDLLRCVCGRTESGQRQLSKPEEGE